MEHFRGQYLTSRTEGWQEKERERDTEQESGEQLYEEITIEEVKETIRNLRKMKRPQDKMELQTKCGIREEKHWKTYRRR